MGKLEEIREEVKRFSNKYGQANKLQLSADYYNDSEVDENLIYKSGSLRLDGIEVLCNILTPSIKFKIKNDTREARYYNKGF